MDAAGDEIIVTITDDGRLFECAVAEVGARREQRWLLIDSDSQLHIGPAWCGDLPEPQLRSLVNDWWRTAKRGNGPPR